MQTLKLSATSVYTLAPTRNVGELQAKLAKCNGKHKRAPIKTCRRSYPQFNAGDSTAEYVHRFWMLNLKESHRGYFAELNTEPCTLYSGEDSFETIEGCDVIDFPAPIDARELQGAELDAAYAEFAFAD